MTETAGSAAAKLEMRLRAIAGQVGRELLPHPPLDRTPVEQYRHLLEEAQELYANELLWEEQSGEEATDTGAVAELVFPGTLALVDALVTSHTPNEHGEGAPHRDVVQAFLGWLSERLARLEAIAGPDETAHAKKIELTEHLLDLVIYRYFGLHGEEIERLEASRH